MDVPISHPQGMLTLLTLPMVIAALTQCSVTDAGSYAWSKLSAMTELDLIRGFGAAQNTAIRDREDDL